VDFYYHLCVVEKTFDNITSIFEIIYASDSRTVMFYLISINSLPHSSNGVESFPAKITRHRFYHTSYNQVKYQTPPNFQEILIFSNKVINCMVPKNCLLIPNVLLKYREEIFRYYFFTGAYFISSLIQCVPLATEPGWMADRCFVSQ
jgi:hypothetical protein